MKLRKEIMGQTMVKHKDSRLVKKKIIIPSGSHFQKGKKERTKPRKKAFIKNYVP